ncbi:MAG TPA: ATP-binding protein [Vicinamibacterales bacterium]|nr:ATP-binding protein [Vicinamibacterales bacterium]
MASPLSISWLDRALARGTSPGDLPLELHRELLAATAGRVSVVLERTARTGEYVATSGLGGTADLQGTWIASRAAPLFEGLSASGPALVSLAGLQPLAERLEAGRALLVPIPSARRPTALIVADPRVPDQEALRAADLALIEFPVALEWSRLARENAFHRALRELSLMVSRGAASAQGLNDALKALVRETNSGFGARRTFVWLLDRRARELSLAATSDPDHAVSPVAHPVDGDAPPAVGLRLEKPQFVGTDAGRVLAVPLRGWRRALGTLLIEGPAASGLDDELLSELAEALGRNVSVAVENVQLLEEVLRQRRLFEDAFNSLADLVVVTDRALRIVQVNDAFEERLEQPRQAVRERPLADVLGRDLALWTSGEERGAESAPAGSCDRTALRTRTFTDLPLPGIFAATVTPLVSQDGESMGRVLVMRDVTVQTRLEAEKEGLHARLAQSEKLAALGQFVAGIAHEMNNPLQGVLGHLELLVTHSEAARPLRRELRRIYREGDRAARIVRNLLVFTGAQRRTRRRLRMERVLARALASRRAALTRQGIEVVRHVGPAVPWIVGDPLLLQQAILNILINAEHAISSSAGGTIELSTRTNSTGSVITTIRDSGPGIPPDALPRIFDPFFTTKEVGKGTGLGLAIAYGIIQEHGGTIHAQNARGGGALFSIELPPAPEARS